MRKTPTDRKVAVIGGGLGGLACSALLAHKGYDVSLFEQQQQVGGKANSKVLAGYRFDTGPSLVTMPYVFEKLFAKTGRTLCDYLTLVPLSPITQYWFSDGTRVFSDRIAPFIQEASTKLQVTRRELERYFAYSRNIFELARIPFLEQSLHRAHALFSLPAVRAFLNMRSLDLRRTMNEANASFFSDPRMVQLLNRYATYNGSNPFLAPATLNNIAYVEHGLGGFGISDGIYGLVKGLERLNRELGVTIHTSTPVTRIRYDRKRCITGVETSNGDFNCSLAVSNVDVLTLYSHLLSDESAPLAARYRRLPPSSSGLVFYWGMRKTYRQLGVHNIFFSSDYRREFQQIHSLGRVPDDPTVYINITSKITPTDAPEGGENWFVLVNVPPHDGRDWTNELIALKERICSKLYPMLGDLEADIAVDGHLTPQQIQDETGSHRGSLYGISSNTRMAAFLRHPNTSKRYKGLYLCGGSVHPGGGMPLATLSGMIAADLIMHDTGKG
ncbi:MAG: phytoene desaturase family protein [Spirochaetota bacterium]